MRQHDMQKTLVQLRTRMPGWVRHLTRVARAAVSSSRPSPPLPQDLLEHCRLCANRHVLIERLPRGGAVAEIGTLRGEFARAILAIAKPSLLHVVDLNLSNLAEDVRSDPRVRLHEGASPDVLAAIADETLDWAYIDADHSYAGAARDAAAAARKIKPGGYLVFNDFAHIDPSLGRYGVHRAVVEFAVTNRWPIVLLSYETNALYDVALQRPAEHDRQAG
jgi:hypothetical protein